MSPDKHSEPRAGGTDLTERRRSGVASGPVHDIEPRDDLATIDSGSAEGTRIGALVTIAAVAAHPTLRRDYPALAAAAGGLATPQIRRMATVGGNLLQRTRCWYFRHPGVSCLKKGGDTCPARTGNHRLGVLFDLGPCVAPHPSTLGAALLAYGAQVLTAQRGVLPVTSIFGDGTDARHDHQIADGDLLTHVHLPAPVAGERGSYVRAIGRAYAEWPLVEAVARLTIEGGRIQMAAVAVGGVAPVPLRLPTVEALLVGREPVAATFEAAAAHAIEQANPLPMTGYKASLLTGTITEALDRAASTVA
jgi:xanthine dehydrogenase YagS FAD-binding subunit